VTLKNIFSVKKTRRKASVPPDEKPLLLYDGDCNFCRRWVYNWQGHTKNQIEYIPYQKLSSRFLEIPMKDFEGSVQLIERDGEIYSGAEAVFRTLSYDPEKKWILWCYQRIPGVSLITEWFYALVAANRMIFSSMTGFLLGDNPAPRTTLITRWVFLRMIGLIYLTAFVSIWMQVDGLLGSNGILPVEGFIRSAGEQLGVERYRLVPTLAWIDSSDTFLHFLCGGGAFLSLLLMIGVASAPVSFLLWLFYLSLVSVGGNFLSFQWDNLLLEVGFLTIFLSPLQILPKFSKEGSPPCIVVWLLRLLLFKLLFSSGIVKLSSGDPVWRDLTALNYHYETQPLSTWVAWYVHQLPEWFQKSSVAVMFGLELFVPLLIFAPRKLRIFACYASIFFQLVIILTGNYCFFNLITIALCILLLDDGVWPVWIREKLNLERNPETSSSSWKWSKWVLIPITCVILSLSTLQMFSAFRTRVSWPGPVIKMYQWLSPFRSVNGYGLFAVMTKSRPEIEVQGSMDGVKWQSYEFKYKPGDVKRRPGFVAPHQPRLDWQMWFAAFSDYRTQQWFFNFCSRLLEGSPSVLRLLSNNPFPENPPKYIRALLYEYKFTDFKLRSEDGSWWKRELKGLYCPILSRKKQP